MNQLKISEKIHPDMHKRFSVRGTPFVSASSKFTDIESDRYLILIRDVDDIALIDRASEKAKTINKRLFIIFIANLPLKSRVKWVGKIYKKFPLVPVAIIPENIIPDFVNMLNITENQTGAVTKEESELMVSTICDRIGINQREAGLLKGYFKSWDDIEQTTKEELCTISGIGQATANKILGGIQQWMNKQNP